ncbi:MAG: ion transporter [Cyclobacteriaceae bacterium]|nr:ion transporter [Cyclobacteriaceae bacterium HetDA_MAG_MS6]
MSTPQESRSFGKLRERLYIIVFGTDTRAGKLFDIVLLCAILGSILAVMLESVKELNDVYGEVFKILEWTLTIFFTLEYFVRLYIVEKPIKYATSFLGVIDLLAIIPTYLTLFVAGGSYFMIIRAIRLLRIFRILKLSRYLGEAQVLVNALKASRYKIMVFLGAVCSLVLIMGTLMYMIEGGENGFTSIPRSIYWAIVTITTVGYGDIAPQTVIGQAFAAILMLMGYAIIAVPTGIVTSEIAAAELDVKQKKAKIVCDNCGETNHSSFAKFCATCGHQIG